ncbi:hypothetical protein D3C85_1362650 [compost metagenome]
MLHLCQHVAQRFGVPALTAAAVCQMVRGRFFRHGHGGFLEHFAHMRQPGLAQGGQLTADPAGGKVQVDGVVGEQFTGKAPGIVDGGLHLGVAFGRAVAQAHHHVR